MASELTILGINAYHADAAACIVRDGKLVAAAEEERFRRIKHWAGFPSQAIAYCLTEAKVDLGDVTHVAVNRSARANFFRKLSYVAFKRPSPRLLLNRLRNRKQVTQIADELGALPGRPICGLNRIRRASPGPSRFGFLSVAFSRCDRRVGRRFRRFCQRRVGLRQRDVVVARRPGAVSALARHLLSGDDPISRLPALWRRIQIDGACRLWQSVVPARSGKARFAARTTAVLRWT